MQRRQEQVILQQEERMRRQERDFASPGKAPVPSLRPETLPKIEGAADAPCLNVTRIQTTGVTLLSDNAVAGLTAPYTGRCLTVADINNLLRDITNAYIERGYVTSRAFVDASGQTGVGDAPAAGDAQPGLLRVLVIEGTIEKIIMNDGEPNSYYRGKTAFPFLEGKPLNLRDIEQGLDQLNRLHSAEATMQLEPGENLGGTVVKVTNQTGRTWRAGLGFDNLGQRTTGKGTYSLSLEKDNLMGIGDQFAVYWAEDIPFWEEEIQDRERIGRNHSFSAYWSLPFGYWTFSGNFSLFSYRSTLFGTNTTYSHNGNTEALNLRAERVIHRDADSKTALSLGFGHRNVDSYIEGYRLDAGSYNLSTLTLGASHSRRLLGGVASLSLDYTRGLRAFGATVPDTHSHFTPQSEFNKFSAYLSYYRPFALPRLETPMYWNFSAYAQMTPETLYGSERIQIGGLGSVRGFLEDSLTGDQGGYARNEIGAALPWFDYLKDNGPVNGLQLYAAYDIGMLRPERRDRFERGRMQGAAVGLRTLGDLSLDVSVAKALEHPSFIKTQDLEFYISAKYTF